MKYNTHLKGNMAINNPVNQGKVTFDFQPVTHPHKTVVLTKVV